MQMQALRGLLSLVLSAGTLTFRDFATLLLRLKPRSQRLNQQ